MASADHLPNLELILPAVVRLLGRHQDLTFELFGSIPVPQALEQFGDRVTKVPAVGEYEEFLAELARRRWDIGICPLVANDFNRAKSINKWVEYTSVGAAVIASGGLIYDDCCSDACGLLANHLDAWDAALERLVIDDHERICMVDRAQRKLEKQYSIAQHRDQLLDVIDLAQRRIQPLRNMHDHR